MANNSGLQFSTRRRKRYLILILILLALIVICLISFKYYYRTFHPNTRVLNDETYLYIPTGAGFQTVIDSLDASGILKDIHSFEWLADKKSYRQKVRPGRYHIKRGMSNNQLINMLRSGLQEPVNIVFNNLRTKEQLAGRLARQLEADSLSLISAMSEYVKQNPQFNEQTILLMFIPNTYEVYWNTSPAKLLQRMSGEYDKFWTAERVSKAEKAGLSKTETGTLASIIETETNRTDEKPIIAGVYINRLQRGIPLQADPTVVFASGDFGLKRVLNKHLAIASPYNTYLHSGLPPGPITLPSISSIEAVLNYKKHDYLFFCASADLSGYHKFAASSAQHLENAREYQKALNRNHIR